MSISYLGPMFFEPYAKEVGTLFDPSKVQNALELSCGTGRLTRHLRRSLFPATKLIASDLSADMLAIAKKNLADQKIDWQVIDAQALPFEDNRFDLVVCYFGYMLMPDKQKAFAEAFRVLKPGGMFVMATWDKLENNESSSVFRTILKKYLGNAIPESYKLPFSLYDSNEISSLLKQAGFKDVLVRRVEKKSVAESSAQAAYGLVMGGSLYNEIVKINPALADEVIATVEAELAAKYGKAPMSAPMNAIITTARK
jgi:ubiquinone/menaquinone biosynthesis C-methylase UbiE